MWSSRREESNLAISDSLQNSGDSGELDNSFSYDDILNQDYDDDDSKANPYAGNDEEEVGYENSVVFEAYGDYYEEDYTTTTTKRPQTTTRKPYVSPF